MMEGPMRPKPNATPDDLAFGINACDIAISAGLARSVHYLRDAVNPRVRRAVEAAREADIPANPVELARLDELTGGGVHQGILVRLRRLPTVDLRAVARERQGPSLILLLDRITDPQNVGAILRTAVAVGVDAVVLPAHRGAALTPGVHRASAGLSLVAPVASPRNLASAVAMLKEERYWVVAADSAPGALPATTYDWPSRAALILGSEGEGVGYLLRRESDFRVALPMDARVESLNVGVACGVLCYLWRRQWPA
jgi:23S rRNA (guanosine2251-2'-O)-methyltransferase